MTATQSGRPFLRELPQARPRGSRYPTERRNVITETAPRRGQSAIQRLVSPLRAVHYAGAAAASVFAILVMIWGRPIELEGDVAGAAPASLMVGTILVLIAISTYYSAATSIVGRAMAFLGFSLMWAFAGPPFVGLLVYLPMLVIAQSGSRVLIALAGFVWVFGFCLMVIQHYVKSFRAEGGVR